MRSCSFNRPLLLRFSVSRVRPGLTLAALLLLSLSVGGCAGFDPARLSFNVDPDEFTTIGW